ncbi:hypothetical protein BGZ83_001941 [Gryganskiella cystojenkinii]|nr:hypothetical protein BGZ83_001941 [Gryganskiella cystojenkinii]
MLTLPPYTPLLDTADAIGALLPLANDGTGRDMTSFSALDQAIQTTIVGTMDRFKALDKAALLEAAFKLKLISIQDELGTRMPELKDTMFRCLDLLLRCSELKLVENAMPLNLLEEVLDFQTVECSERIYDYLESRVERLTALLRRLSKAKNTVYCGRILMLLSSVFPLTERSGVNVRGDFNTENVTHIENEDLSIIPEIVSTPIEESSGEKMDVDDDSGAPSKSASSEVAKREDGPKKDADFYKEFWGLQNLFSNPHLLVKNPENMKKLQLGIERTLNKFAAIEEKESKSRGQRKGSVDASADTRSTSDSSKSQSTARGDGKTVVSTKRKHVQIKDVDAGPSTYFPKFLTSPKLLQLEIVDPYFRKHILVQFLIVIQYLQHHSTSTIDAYAKLPVTNKFFHPQWALEDKDREWTEECRPRILRAIKAVGEETGDLSFYSSVRSVLSDEESWIQWKAENCHSFEKPSMSPEEVKAIQEKRQKLSQSLTPLKEKMGCRTLSKVWKLAEDLPKKDELHNGLKLPHDLDDYLNTADTTIRDREQAKPQVRKWEKEKKARDAAKKDKKEQEEAEKAKEEAEKATQDNNDEKKEDEKAKNNAETDKEADKDKKVTEKAKKEGDKNKKQGEKEEEARPEFRTEEEQELDRARMWRALRMGSNRYIHIYKPVHERFEIEDLKKLVEKDQKKEEAILANGGVVLASKPESEMNGETLVSTLSSLTSTASADGKEKEEKDEESGGKNSEEMDDFGETDSDLLTLEEKPTENKLESSQDAMAIDLATPSDGTPAGSVMDDMEEIEDRDDAGSKSPSPGTPAADAATSMDVDPEA